MKFNATKTKTMIVSRSHTVHPQSPSLIIGGTVLKESDDLVILGVTIDSKINFGKHLCSVSRAAGLTGFQLTCFQITGRTPHSHEQYLLSASCIIYIGEAQAQPGFDLATFSIRGNHLACAATGYKPSHSYTVSAIFMATHILSSFSLKNQQKWKFIIWAY